MSVNQQYQGELHKIVLILQNLEYLQYELQQFQEAEANEILKNQQKIDAMRERLYKQEQKQMFEMHHGDSSEESSSDDDDFVQARSSSDSVSQEPPDARKNYVGDQVERQISTRPTSRRRPQSSNLYGTERNNIPQQNEMISEEGEEDLQSRSRSNSRTETRSEYSSEESGEQSIYSTEEDSEDLNESDEEASQNPSESDDEI